MERREMIKRVALLTGVAVIGGEVFISGCKSNTDSSVDVLSALNIDLLNEVGSIILPAPQNSIGAKDVNIGNFISTMVNDCYQDADKKIFIEGCRMIETKFKEKNKTSFIQATSEEKLAFLTEIDNESRAYNKNKKKEDPNHFFTMMRQLTILGFAVSKEASDNKVFSWIPVPGKYDGALPYKKGDITYM